MLFEATKDSFPPQKNTKSFKHFGGRIFLKTYFENQTNVNAMRQLSNEEKLRFR